MYRDKYDEQAHQVCPFKKRGYRQQKRCLYQILKQELYQEKFKVKDIIKTQPGINQQR